jgi:glycosyltransferase involved in cell wall biosynthesis
METNSRDGRLVLFVFSYDYANFLQECLDSCLRELGRDFQWVLVETGDTESTKLIASEFAAKNQVKIDYLKLEKTSTLIAVLKLSKIYSQKHAILLSADDLLGENYGDQVRFELAQVYNKPTIVNFQHIICDDRLNPLSMRIPKWSSTIYANQRRLTIGNPGNTAGALLPWEFVSNTLTKDKIPSILIEDYWLWWQSVEECDFKNNTLGTVLYRKHAASTTSASRNSHYAFSLGYVSALPCYMNKNVLNRLLGLFLIFRWGRHLHYSVWDSYRKGYIESFRWFKK